MLALFDRRTTIILNFTEVVVSTFSECFLFDLDLIPLDIEVTDGFYECDMVPHLTKCNQPSTGWSVGLEGDCVFPETGVKYGPNGIKKVGIAVS